MRARLSTCSGIPEGMAMTRFRTVVCAVDFSETSQDAVAVARDIAEGASAHLHLVHVVLDPLQLPWSLETAAMDFAEMLRNWIQSTEQELSKLADSLPPG